MENIYTRYSCLLAVLLLGLVAPALAQEKIDADRPDQSQGPAVVQRGLVQLEAGFLHQKRDSRISTYAYPTSLLRIGLLEGVELRVQGAVKDSVIRNGTDRHIRGWGPISVGTKIRLWEAKGWRPAAAVMAMAALPIASEVFRPSNVEPQINLGFLNELSDKMDLTYNIGYGWTDGEPVRSYGANIAREVTDKLTLYLEAFGSKGKGEPSEHEADLGLLYLLLPNLQIDIAYGRRVNKAAPHSFFATGLAVRLPR